MSNVDAIVEHLLKNSKTLGAEKITAFGVVIKALGGENRVSEPNDVKAEPTLLDEEQPMNLEDIQNIEIDGVGSKPVRIYQ